MVQLMPYDRGGVPRVAWTWLIMGLCGATACVPATVPTGPGEGPGMGVGVVNHMPRPKPATSGRQVVIGEMCPLGAAGRPGLAPIAMRSVQWSDTAADIANVIERGGVPRFAVYGVDGKVAGEFETLGLAEIGLNQPIVSGGYAGAQPCTYEVSPTIPDAPDPGRGAGSGSAAPTPARGAAPAHGAPAAPAGKKPDVGAAAIAMRAEDPRCMPATGGCGLAIGEIVHPDDPPSTPPFVAGTACVAGDELAVDIDGDGVVESFPLATILDGSHSPAAEWTAAPTAGAPCKPTFQTFDIKLAPDSEPGRPGDARGAVTMDVLGVVDVDGDGRREVILALRFPTVRTIVIYTPSGSAQRLELAGEATSFPR